MSEAARKWRLKFGKTQWPMTTKLEDEIFDAGVSEGVEQERARVRAEVWRQLGYNGLPRVNAESILAWLDAPATPESTI